MSQLTSVKHSSVSQKTSAKIVLVVFPISCLVWGMSTIGLTFSVLSQESGVRSHESTEAENRHNKEAITDRPLPQPPPSLSPTYSPTQSSTSPRVQDLLQRPKLKPDGDSQPTEEGSFNSYRLGPGDAIAITVTPRSKDLSFNATLDWQGNVSAPLIGQQNLRNLTINQVQQKLQTAFAEYLVNPRVGITLGTPRTVKVMITGEVAKPGFYALQDPRLPTALIEAGGTTRFADLRSVQVRRAIDSDQPLEQQFDLFTPLKEGTLLPDLRLVDGDVITIPVLTAGARNEYDRELFAKSNVGQPKITVRVLDHSAGVNRLQLENGSDFLDALTSIKPEIERVNLKKVLLIRFDAKQGKAVTQTINARDALKGDQTQNPILEHNDVIVLDRTWIAKFNYTLNQITQPFKDALGFLLFFDSGFKGITNMFGSEEQKK